MKTFYLNAAASILAVGLVATPVYALDLGGGHDSGSHSHSGSSSSGGGGVSASASVGGSDSAAEADVSVGSAANASVSVGSKDSVASGKANALGNKATVDIGKGSGPLVSGSQDGNPLAGTSNTDVDVNLGGFGKLFEGHDGNHGGNNNGGMTAGEIETAFHSLSGGEQRQMKVTCGAVLNSPNRYDAGLVQLCQLLITL